MSRRAEQAKTRTGEDHGNFPQMKKLKRKQDTACTGQCDQVKQLMDELNY